MEHQYLKRWLLVLLVSLGTILTAIFAMAQTHYDILGVRPDATEEEITSAYRSLIKKYHPDRVGVRGHALSSEVNKAYAILTDEAKRQQYDKSMGFSQSMRGAKKWVPSELSSSGGNQKKVTTSDGRVQFPDLGSKNPAAKAKIDATGKVIFPNLQKEKTNPPTSPPPTTKASSPSRPPDSRNEPPAVKSVPAVKPNGPKPRTVVGELVDDRLTPDRTKPYKDVQKAGNCQIAEEMVTILEGEFTLEK